MSEPVQVYTACQFVRIQKITKGSPQNRTDIWVSGLPFFETISDHTIKFILPKFVCIGIIALYKIDI